MANIFKTTLKKDIIADIADNNKRDVRFPITKFWATRFTDEYNLNDKTFVFKTFDSLELSAPSNKDTEGQTYVFDYVRTFVDGDEFVIEFKDNECGTENCQIDDSDYDVQNIELDNILSDNEMSMDKQDEDEPVDFTDEEKDDENILDDEIEFIDNSDIFEAVKQWFDEKNILSELYENEDIIATNARQVIILPKGKVLGSKKTLPVNNDAEVRVEFDMSEKVYFDATFDLDDFEDDIFRILSEIRKNNFVFIWKRHTGIFMDDNGVYFGMKYSTRKSIGFNHKYNVQ